MTFKGGELVIATLYQRSQAGTPNPNTKARAREVTDLTRDGLQFALDALASGAEAPATLVGTSGFTQREDVLLATTSPGKAKLVKGA